MIEDLFLILLIIVVFAYCIPSCEKEVKVIEVIDFTEDSYERQSGKFIVEEHNFYVMDIMKNVYSTCSLNVYNIVNKPGKHEIVVSKCDPWIISEVRS